MARTTVAVILSLWLVLLLIHPVLATLPLYGLYPGEMASGEPTYYPRLMRVWAIAMGAAFAVLGLIALVRNHRPTAFAFASLFLLSSIAFYVRFVQSMRDV
jgi:hypothetical protein